MKAVFLILLCTFLSGLCFSQDIRDGYHITNYRANVRKCDKNGVQPNPAINAKLEANWKFRVLDEIGNDYVIEVLNFPTSYKNYRALNQDFVTDSTDRDIYFLLDKDEYKIKAERLQKRGSFTVGAATTLIKIRPGKKEPKDGYNIYSEFGNDFNIGISAGWKFTPYRRLELEHSFVLGLSFSSIKVTPYTTKDFISSESTQSCVTFSTGYVFAYNKFQVSVFTGLDVMSGEIGRHWIYKNRPWLGLGFGFQIFRAQGEKSQTEE